MSLLRWLICLLFLCAGLGLVRQIIQGNGLTDQCLAVAFLLFCVEQARMALIDLQQIDAVSQQKQDNRLDHFFKVTVSTIVLELLGFYIASVWLGWGAVLVLLSQVWFNLLAGIQLQPAQAIFIQAWGISERLPLLIADGVGLTLVGLWIGQIAPFWMASGLLGLVLIFGWVKYVLPNIKAWRSRNPSLR